MDVKLTLDWVSPKYGSMGKGMVVRSEVPLTFLYMFIQS